MTYSVRRAREPDDCPHCNQPFDIVAVGASLLRGTSALFVCPYCGLARPESRDEARRKLLFWLNEAGVLSFLSPCFRAKQKT